MYLTTYVKETPEGQYKAEIHEIKSGYLVEYYKPTGEKFKSEKFSNSIFYVKNEVEDWISNITQLNG